MENLFGLLLMEQWRSTVTENGGFINSIIWTTKYEQTKQKKIGENVEIFKEQQSSVCYNINQF